MGEAGTGADTGVLPQRNIAAIEPLVPVLREFVHRYFRAEIRGMERIPGPPVVFVGNHSGGFGSPDSAVFILEYLHRYGSDRPLYWLAHELLMNIPVVGDLLGMAGAVTASPEVARTALNSGADVIAYPGGEVELHRPWTARNEIRFLGRTGWIRLALDTGAPLVPVVAAGGHNNYLCLTDGQWIARGLGLDRLLNLRTFPISLALPWGINVGDFVGHLPLPVKIRVEVGDPIDVRERFGDDVPRAYDEITSLMQATLDRLATGG